MSRLIDSNRVSGLISVGNEVKKFSLRSSFLSSVAAILQDGRKGRFLLLRSNTGTKGLASRCSIPFIVLQQTLSKHQVNK